MRYLDSFHYQITGNPQGHKLVFLHGLMGSGLNFRRIGQAFENEFHILAFDQRGHGRSFHPESGYHPRDYAGDLRQILDELGWDQIALVGHSMGGRNALAFAAQFSQRVKALVIEDIGPEASSVAMNRIERLIAEVPTPFHSRSEAKAFFENEYPDRISWYPAAQVVSRFLLSNIEQKADGTLDWRFAKEAILKSARDGRNEDQWDNWRNLHMPVLLVRGAESSDLTPEIFSKMKATLPGVEAVEVPGSGHWVHFDQPEVFISLLRRFFHRVFGTNL